jgi:hypothetical protein
VAVTRQLLSGAGKHIYPWHRSGHPIGEQILTEDVGFLIDPDEFGSYLNPSLCHA